MKVPSKIIHHSAKAMRSIERRIWITPLHRENNQLAEILEKQTVEFLNKIVENFKNFPLNHSNENAQKSTPIL